MSKKINFFSLSVAVVVNLYSFGLYAQDSLIATPSMHASPTIDKAFQKLGKKYDDLGKSVNAGSMKILSKMENTENLLQKKIALKDSLGASQLFADAKARYKTLKDELQSPVTKIVPRPLQEYIPRLDSLQTTMHFLGQGGIAIPGVSSSQLQQAQALSGHLTQLQGRFQQAGEIQNFIRQREQQLKDQLVKNGLSKQVLGMNKNIYYYQQQLSDYKKIVNDQEKLEETALSLVRELPAFQSFMQKNSYLGQLFPMPQNYGTPQALEGVPTSADLGKMIAERIGSTVENINPQQYLQEQAQSGQDQLSELKDKVAKAGGNNSDMEMPQFTPNNQKTRSFLHRLEFGFNIQSQRATLLPVTTDIALTAGYRINDKATLGIGAAYKLGWGSGWDHVALSNQGIGLRSYLDIKAKGSIWITGGFEYNYMQEFAKLTDIRNLDVWQKSALIGLTKKYKVGRQTGNIQLLYDFLAQHEIPRATALKFRVGYAF